MKRIVKINRLTLFTKFQPIGPIGQEPQICRPVLAKNLIIGGWVMKNALPTPPPSLNPWMGGLHELCVTHALLHFEILHYILFA